MRWLTNFYDFRFKWTATPGIGIHPTKARLSQLVSFKMQSGREDTLEEWYAIRFCFKLWKNARETYGMLQTAFRPSCMNRAWVFEWHKRFKEGRESVREDQVCGRSKCPYEKKSGNLFNDPRIWKTYYVYHEIFYTLSIYHVNYYIYQIHIICYIISYIHYVWYYII